MPHQEFRLDFQFLEEHFLESNGIKYTGYRLTGYYYDSFNFRTALNMPIDDGWLLFMIGAAFQDLQLFIMQPMMAADVWVLLQIKIMVRQVERI